MKRSSKERIKIGYYRTLKSDYQLFEVEGVDVTCKNGWQINIRPHGYRILKDGKTIANVDFDK